MELLQKNVAPYAPKKGEQYMNAGQRAHFRKILETLKAELSDDIDRTVQTMQHEATLFADPNDRATQESDMALELRNRLEAGTGLALSATLAWNYPTIAALADHLAELLEIPLVEMPPQAADDPRADVADDLAALSQEEVSNLIEEELALLVALLPRHRADE